MRLANKKTIAVIIALFLTSLMTGCTNWKAEYDKLYVVKSKPRRSAFR